MTSVSIPARRHAARIALTALITGAGLATLAQAPPPLIAVLHHGFEPVLQENLAAFRAGMTALGHVEGRSYRLERRVSDGVAERLPALAEELLRAGPAVIVVSSGLAAQDVWRATKTVPIVVTSGAGLLETGMIASFSRPGGNVTGIVNRTDEMTEKLFEILRDMVPGARHVLALSSGRGLQEAEVRRAGRRAGEHLGLAVADVFASTPEQIAGLPEICRRLGCNGLVLVPDPIVSVFPSDIVRAAEAMRVPAIGTNLAFVDAGGLVSYGPPAAPAWRRCANYADRILKGAPPGDLPLERLAVFELRINLRAAKSLGIVLPHALLLRADEVIE